GFIGGMVTEAMDGWDSSMTMMAEQGVPVEFMSWDAIRKLEAGLSVKGDGPSTAAGLMAAVQITFAEGLSERAFDFVGELLSDMGSTEVVRGEGGSIMYFTPSPEMSNLFGGVGADLQKDWWLHSQEMPPMKLELIGNKLRLDVTNMNYEGASLASKANFLRGRDQVLQPGIVCFSYFNPQAIAEMQSSLSISSSDGAELDSMNQALAALTKSATGAQAISYGAGWKEGRSVSSTFVDLNGSPSGWASPTGAVDRSMVEYIPGDASKFSLASLSGTEGMAELFSSFDAVLEDGEMAQNLAVWSEAEPVSYSWLAGDLRPVLDEALKGFGKRALSYDSPTRGSRMLIELRDPDAVQAAATPLVKTVSQLLDSIEGAPVALRARRESPRANPQQTVPVYYLRLKPEMMPPTFEQISMFIGNVEPSFAISPDGWLVFSMNRADVRSVVRSGLKAESNDIRSNPEAADFLRRVPQSAIELAWSDPRPTVTSTMSMAQAASGLLGMQMDPSQMPVDLSKMPSANALNRHLSTSESFTWADNKESASSWAVGSVGVADFLTVVGYAVPVGMMSFAFMTSIAMPPPELLIGEPPSTSAASPEIGRARALIDLANLQTGAIIYQLLTEEYPKSLDDLLGEVDGQPLLDTPGAAVPNDPWGSPYIYRQMANGFMIYSVGPNGQDEGGQGDDVSVEG
ncbi:MAG: type II secretion system protein GspG, partial [Planctomycetes bacterium]|nr:type II secretion system protein GspG [Planctomycetota bacterium]